MRCPCSCFFSSFFLSSSHFACSGERSLYGYPKSALAAAASSGLSSRVRNAALAFGGAAMASTSDHPRTPDGHDDRKPESFRSAAAVVDRSAEHRAPEMDALGPLPKQAASTQDTEQHIAISHASHANPPRTRVSASSLCVNERPPFPATRKTLSECARPLPAMSPSTMQTRSG